MSVKNEHLPEFFRPLFWAYNFESLDLEKNKKTIVINAINYGDLKHWRWLKNHYGQEVVKEIIEKMSAAELKKRSAKLAGILFGAKLNYAPRGAN